MDISDFTQGIVTDVDSQDAAGVQGSVSECINFDLFPGHVQSRKGFADTTFTVYEHQHDALADHTSWNDQLDATGTFPAADEEIIQHVVVRAPNAFAGSIPDFNPADEWCFNKNVTVFLVRATGANPGFRLYGDFHFEGRFERLNWGATEFQKSVNAEDPFMIVHGGSIGIGGIEALEDARDGVLWLGHVKRLAGYMRTPPVPPALVGTYGWASSVDEWRLTDAELYDSYEDLEVEALVSSYEKIYEQTNQPTGYIGLLGTAAVPPVDPKMVLRRGVTPWLLTENRTKDFNVKVTALYDGYQESRPLRWKSKPYRTADIGALSQTFGYGYDRTTTPWSEILPLNWQISRDPLYSQYLRVRIEDTRPRTSCDCWMRGPMVNAGSGDIAPGYPAETFMTRWRMTWNNLYRDDSIPEDTGLDFFIKVTIKDDMSFSEFSNVQKSTVVNYKWKTTGSMTVGLELELTPTKDARIDCAGAILWALGLDVDLSTIPNVGDPGFYGGHTELLAQIRKMEGIAEIRSGRQTCREKFQITNVQNEVAQSQIGTYSPTLWAPLGVYNSNTKAFHEFTITSSEYSATPIGSGWQCVFGLVDRLGAGLLGILPSFPEAYTAESSGSLDPLLTRPGRRLTGFRIYVQEKDIDPDYRMVRQINLDYAESEKKHGGFGDEDEKAIVTWREGTFPSGKAPTWMVRNGRIMPYLSYDAVDDRLIVDSPVGPLRGGLSRAFVIADTELVDTAGKSLLSQNLMRDETKTDRPNWKRGAVCEGRLFGLSMSDNDLQYNVMAAGVSQWDIMPGSFPVSKGEKLTHIVSWRGQHHMVFTDENLWRIDLADGDEFSWRVMDTYAKKGTTLWRTIIDTPFGLAYASPLGIFMYDGNLPKSMTDGRWSKHLWTVAPNFTEASTFAGYNGVKDEVWFSLNMHSTNYPWVWLFDLRTRAWRKYELPFATGVSYMTTMDGEFFAMAKGSGWKKQSRTSFVDEHGALSIPYPVHLITQELPPPDQTQTMYWQYLGVRYKADVSVPVKVSLRTSAYHDTRHPALEIVCNKNRREYFFPLPMGFGRGTRIVFSQGAYMGDVNEPNDITLSSFSLRGTPHEQWRGTR